MIPADFITEWRGKVRWALDEQVEQDLVLSRSLAEIFGDPQLAGELALRGGTALHKLYLAPARRYSNDIDLVQLKPGPFGPTISRLRKRLDHWLGEPKRERGQGVRLIYRFDSEIPPVVRLKLKIETNTREHVAVQGTVTMPFAVESRWWRGSAQVTTYGLEEILATKLRALYQRKKARDIYDLFIGLEMGAVPAEVVRIFRAYAERGSLVITRALFEKNLSGKLRLASFTEDLPMLLPPGVAFDIDAASAKVHRELISLLPGDRWKGPGAKDASSGGMGRMG